MSVSHLEELFHLDRIQALLTLLRGHLALAGERCVCVGVCVCARARVAVVVVMCVLGGGV